MEKWKNKKWGNDRKIGGYKKFSFFSYVFLEDGKVERWKTLFFFFWEEKWEDEKFNSDKFTLIPLLYNTIKTL